MEHQDRIMDGDLQTLGLQSVLKMLALSGKTGTLFIYSGPETLTISLRKGQIVGLREEGGIQPDIVNMLCLINKLDPARGQAVREISQGNPQLALAMLVEHNWMSSTEMQQRLEFTVTQLISHALCWVDGRFAFHRQLVPMESRMLPLDVDSVLLEALRQADEWEEMEQKYLTCTTVARWLPEVNNDVRNLGLSQEHIEVICLCNGEIPLQSIASALLIPEARVGRVMVRLLELHLIEIVDTALETELQQDLSNIIIKCQHMLAQHRQVSHPEQHLVGLIAVLSVCINGLLIHHGRYAKRLRGRGKLPADDITSYLEQRFVQQLRVLTKQQYPILETTSFNNGQLDCTDILTLGKVVKGEKLEEFYWEAVLGLNVFLRMIFRELLQDELGNSHTSHYLSGVWKAFLQEVDQEIQQYHLFRAHQHVEGGRGQEVKQPISSVEGELPSNAYREMQRELL